MGALPHVVIVGGGFGGLYAARSLAKAPVRITLVDRRNHHLFQPLLYQVASAALNPSDIATPIRAVLARQKNVRVILARALAVEPEARRLVLDQGALEYDHLILAVGATHSYFGKDEWAAHAPGLKSVEDALEIRKRVLLAFEAAERETDLEIRRTWLNFVVVGGGPTGTEMAGALSEISRHTLARDFRSIDPTHARVILVEGAERVLGQYSESLSDAARRQLVKLGVEVRLGTQVTQVDGEGVVLGSERIRARTVIWAAGVRASSLVSTLGAPLDGAGRVRVEPDLSLPGHPEVLVIGDAAFLEQDGGQVFGVAPAAIQAGKHAAAAVRLQLAGKPALPFRYVDKGSMATIGRRAAVARMGSLELSGLPAWMAWLFIHLLFLVGFRNKAIVIFQWMWSYVTFQRGARLITGSSSDDLPPSAVDLPRLAETGLPERGSDTGSSRVG